MRAMGDVNRQDIGIVVPKNAVWGFVFSFLIGVFLLYQSIGSLQARADNKDVVDNQQNIRLANQDKQNELLIRVDANVTNLKEQVKDLQSQLAEKSRK